MKTKDILDQFTAKAREASIPGKNYKLWTVGKSRTIHVTCTHVSAPRLQWVADQLIFLHRGVRYATIRVEGMLGGRSVSSFCFKLGVARQ